MPFLLLPSLMFSSRSLARYNGIKFYIKNEKFRFVGCLSSVTRRLDYFQYLLFTINKICPKKIYLILPHLITVFNLSFQNFANTKFTVKSLPKISKILTNLVTLFNLSFLTAFNSRRRSSITDVM